MVTLKGSLSKAPENPSNFKVGGKELEAEQEGRVSAEVAPEKFLKLLLM